MMQIKIENGRAKVFTPYNAEYVAKIKKIGDHKWHGTEKCWSVPETEVDTVRNYMMEVYGETDVSEDEKITVRVTFNQTEYAERSAIFLFGKSIARAYDRDSGAVVGTDVTLISGNIGSGGSRNRWTTIIYKGTVLKVRNVSRNALGINNEDYDITVEEIEDSTIDYKALEEERAKLLHRIEEIDAMLAKKGE